MADESDTDRLAGALMNALLGSMANPMAGLGVRPQVDESSMFNMIKDFLQREKPEINTQTSSTPVTTRSEAGGWEGLFRRQAQEREAMHEFQQREREEMHQRHLLEMEAAMKGEGAVSGASPSAKRRARTTRQARPTTHSGM